MRLLLDEMYPHAIAEQLRRLGHDVDAIPERAELRMLSDIAVFATAQQERRAVLTENIADFSKIADGHDSRGEAHHGLLLIHPGKYPRGDPQTIGPMVEEINRLLREHPRDTATSLRHWL